tara:strand:- start:263 stop:658 length:396 start_codon:yes stop_codon:yes gene_type:complete
MPSGRNKINEILLRAIKDMLMRPLSKFESVFSSLFIGLFLFFLSSKAWAVNITADTTVSNDLTTQHTFTADNKTLTVTGSIKYSGNNPIIGSQNPGRTNNTIVVNSGATVATVGAGTERAVNLTHSTGASN